MNPLQQTIPTNLTVKLFQNHSTETTAMTYVYKTCLGAGIAQLVVLGLAVHSVDPSLGTFSGRGDFSLGVNMGSNSIPPKTLSDESINRGLVCAHMHFIARTQKILTFMS